MMHFKNRKQRIWCHSYSIMIRIATFSCSISITKTISDSLWILWVCKFFLSQIVNRLSIDFCLMHNTVHHHLLFVYYYAINSSYFFCHLRAFSNFIDKISSSYYYLYYRTQSAIASLNSNFRKSIYFISWHILQSTYQTSNWSKNKFATTVAISQVKIFALFCQTWWIIKEINVYSMSPHYKYISIKLACLILRLV